VWPAATCYEGQITSCDTRRIPDLSLARSPDDRQLVYSEQELHMTDPVHATRADAARRAIDAAGVIAIIRGDFLQSAAAIAEVFDEAGIRAVEVTMNAPRAAELFRALADPGDGHLVMGVGTVRSQVDLARAIDWGAAFVVSPHVDEEIVRRAVDAGLMAIPGAFSPTEAVRARMAGAQAVKIFPAETLGPGFVKAMCAPLPDIPLVPTGGVTLELAREFRKVGAWAVGVGSPLVGPPGTADQAWRDGLLVRAKAFAAAMRAVPSAPDPS
jgi:2-dehydro-3-deoxyphosphogluconate aldolase/(4S)-4-hydroxy-2-oxoglutarate aldolase